MKYILIILLLISCSDKKDRYYEKVIRVKRYQDTFGDTLPKGICNFRLGFDYYFQDSCKYYMVGDTIGVTKIRNYGNRK